MIGSTLLIIAVFGMFALLVTAALSPLETLSWWAGWTEDEIEPPTQTVQSDPRDGSPDHEFYIIYLSGIASISGKHLIARESRFLKNLETALPNAKILPGVFPYSPKGLPLLAAQRFFDGVWRQFQLHQIQGRQSILSVLINMRNVFQVMVSADHRYGPIFNQGAARVIEDKLSEAGYTPGSNARIVIIGYSGGAQIAVGASSFLKARLNASIDVISIGGVIASDTGLSFINSLHHFHGSRDRIEKIGAVVFPERWRIMGFSEWNQGKLSGRITLHTLEKIGHAGVQGYFGLFKTNGMSNNERLVREITQVLSVPSTNQQ